MFPAETLYESTTSLCHNVGFIVLSREQRGLIFKFLESHFLKSIVTLHMNKIIPPTWKVLNLLWLNTLWSCSLVYNYIYCYQQAAQSQEIIWNMSLQKYTCTLSRNCFVFQGLQIVVTSFGYWGKYHGIQPISSLAACNKK